MFHIIPDIHGEFDKLDAMIGRLGWRRTPSGWVNDRGATNIVFLGDFIDRGAQNGAVISLVRDLVDSGKARAVMGNHELNALMMHYEGEGGPLRKRTPSNLAQHASFLEEFPFGAPETKDVLDWFATLPVSYENNWFRAIHACWHQPSLDLLPRRGNTYYLPEHLGDLQGEVMNAAEVVMKGPEHKPGGGFQFKDHGGHSRSTMRLRWWHPDPQSWGDVAASLPADTPMPEGPITKDVKAYSYKDDKFLFFGHYWMTGEVKIEHERALCLDYSVAAGGPLTAYSFVPGDTFLNHDNIYQYGRVGSWL